MENELKYIEVAGIKWATENLEVDGKGNFIFIEANSLCPPGWRLPTQSEFQQLCEQCDYSFVDGYGVFTDKKTGAKLRLPAAGYSFPDGTTYVVGSGGYYWSSTVYNSGFGYYLYFISGGATRRYYSGYAFGLGVRYVLID